MPSATLLFRCRFYLAAAFPVAALAYACSGPSSNEPPAAQGGMTPAAGGVTSSGGANTGGLSVNGGVSGSAAGGATGTGGTYYGGAPSGGTASAGAAGSSDAKGGAGGAAGGGNPGTGGAVTVLGGTTGTAGTANGGATATGGRSSGGTSALGGATGMSPPIGKKFVGNIDARNQIRPDFNKFWNQFSPENAGKWELVERTRDQMNWNTLDTMYAYAKQNKVIFKQHTLLWGRQQPTWLNNLSQAEQREEVEEWIRLYCERYPDTPIIDVVNEPPPHTTPVYVAALGGAGSSGYDWIAQAFKWAHQYCPNSILLLNDYNNIEYQADVAHTIDIVKKIKAAGAPIDAVGCQAHDAYKMSTNTVQSFIDRIANETGLPVYITEYDIDLADDNQQRSVMQSQFTMFYNNANVKGITLWGYVSGMTWKANTGLMSSNGNMRPAMTWLLDYLEIQAQ